MAATCSESRSVASLMLVGDPLPEASLVMPIAFPLLVACAVISPECASRARSAHHPPAGHMSGNYNERTSKGIVQANFGEHLTGEVPRIHLLGTWVNKASCFHRRFITASSPCALLLPLIRSHDALSGGSAHEIV